MNYRKEIDGLRALAVLPVILFHAGFESFSGGFVGVDVFFVISGYLITSIIIFELELEKFSLAKFYERRARRILPALFFITLTSVPFAWFLLLPSDLKDFSQSLVAISLFSSNFLFYTESGYFEVASELKPLLHTWSLAVEEQFYLFFPLFLILLWRWGKNWTLFALGTIFFLSLALAQWTTYAMPTASFYLLPTRCWELLLGSFAAFYLYKSESINLKKGLVETGGWFGLVLIIFAVFTYNESTPFPGFYALIPTLGTLLIILLANGETTIGKFIGNKLFVFVGLISYSAYLWHQPILAFARHYGIADSNKLIFFLLSLSALFLAYFSWKFIEMPFRDNSKISKKKVLIFSLLGSVFIMSIGLYGHKKNGDLGQLSEAQTSLLDFYENKIPAWNYITKEEISKKFRYDCDFYDIQKYRSGNITRVPVSKISKSCFMKQVQGSKVIFIWGDSHAQQLYYGLSKVLPIGYEILQVASSSCSAQLVTKKSSIDYCDQSNWFALETIKKVKPHVVIIGQRSDHDSIKIKKLAKSLKEIGVNKVIHTGPSPKWVPSLPTVVARMLPTSTTLQDRTFYGLDEGSIKLDKKVKNELINSEYVDYVSLIDFLCNEEGCLTHYKPYSEDSLTSWDQTHLTPIASYYLARDLLSPKILLNE